MIKAVNILKSYNDLQVLKGVNLSVNEGEVIAITGASGAGKTTLLQILGTLEKYDTGSLLINNTEVSNLKSKELANFRNNNIGFIFQFHHLLAEFSALENVCIPAFINKTSKADAIKRAEILLDDLGVLERKYHKPNELSGGEQQRVAIARALMNNPKVIFADEPSGNLDSKNSDELHKMFFELRDKYNQTFIIVTHNKDLAAMADRTLIIKDGIIT